MNFDLDAALAIARQAAEAADGILRRYFRSGLAVETKADATPVTAADREAEQAIRDVLAAAYPGHAIFGEEQGRGEGDADFLWLVDPLDGTKSFVRGTPFFSTQIALMHRGELVLGVSSAPLFGEICWAVRGGGAWCNGERIRIAETTRLTDAALSTGNIASLASDPARWQAFGALVGECNRVRGYGDFCHYHLLARGALDAVIESDLNILDIAALAVIVREAGGRFTDLDGQALSLETSSAMAAVPALHDELLARFAS